LGQEVQRLENLDELFVSERGSCVATEDVLQVAAEAFGDELL
jgi:hypothetical protein